MGEERWWAFGNRKVDMLAKHGAEADDAKGMAGPRHLTMAALSSKIEASISFAADLWVQQGKWGDLSPKEPEPHCGGSGAIGTWAEHKQDIRQHTTHTRSHNLETNSS